MIVFTAKSKITEEVYVGSARHCVEEHWAHLIVQAEEGGTGNLLNLIRTHGSDHIEIETWGFADSPAESRELIRDACEDLNAEAIKTGRAPAVKTTATVKRTKPAASAPALIETKDKPVVKKPSSSEHGPVVSIDISKYQAEQKTPEKTVSAPEVVSLRHSESTKVAEDMRSVMISIEMQRKKNMKTYTPPKKATKKITAIKGAKSRSTAAAEKTKKLKLPDGRVSSSVKEKKIKEAIAQEKFQRQAEHTAKAAAEAADMAALLARIDERTRTTSKISRRR